MRTLLILLLLSYQTFAVDPVKISSSIDHVTVFQNGAQVVRLGRVQFIPAGKTELYFDGLSPKMDRQSVQLSTKGNLTVVSIHTNQMGTENGSARYAKTQEIEKRRKAVEMKLKTEEKFLKVFQQEESLILKNQELGGKVQVLKAAEIKEAADFQRTRLTEILTRELEIEQKIEQLHTELKELNQEQTLLTTKSDTQQSEVRITVSTKEPLSNVSFTLTYVVTDAGWIPSYDARVSDLTKPLTMALKADVFQYSGEDWNQVKLSLSTADPRRKTVLPMLKTWVAGTKNYYPELNQQSYTFTPTITQVAGKVTDDTGSPIPGALVQIDRTTIQTSTDENGLYQLSLPPRLPNGANTLKFSSIGYFAAVEPLYKEQIDVKLRPDTKSLEEVVVVGYGTQRKKDITGSVAAIPAKVPLDLTEKEAPNSFQYDILIPYTIPSNGKVTEVEVKEMEIPTAYQYSAVPKLTSDVILIAQLTGWESYQLMEGEMNLFLEGTFVGKSALVLDPATDTLRISLGKDAAVQVNRVKLKEFSKKSFWGNTHTEERGYEINVRNTRRQAIHLVVYDQFPVSTRKEVEILNQKAPGAELTPDTGLLQWKMELKPAESRTVQLSYAIRTPASGIIKIDQ